LDFRSTFSCSMAHVELKVKLAAEIHPVKVEDIRYHLI